MSLNENNRKKNNAKLPIPRVVTVFVLLALLIIGLVSTTFASFIPENANADDGSLVAQVKSAVVNRSKDDLADIKANVDKAETGATKTYYFGFTSWSSLHKAWFDGGSVANADYKSSFVNQNKTFSYDVGTNGNQTYNVYSVTVDASYTGAYITVTNNNTNYETSKITLDSSKITLVTEWGGGAKFGQTAYSGGSSTTSTVYIPGEFNSWSTSGDTHKCANIAGTTKYTYSVSLSKSTTYEFKVHKDGTWYGNDGKITETVSGWTFSTSEGKNCEITTGIAGIYTFTFDSSDNKLSVTYPSGYTYTVEAGTGGTVTPKSGTATLVTIKATANDGYKFKNWTVTGGSVANSTSASTTFTITANGAKATANFVKVYTVTYNANGGSGAPSAVSNVESGTNFTISSTKPTKTGHTFKNWNTAANGSGTSYASGGTISNVKADITLYAQYTPNTYTVTLNANGGTINSDNVTSYTYGTAVTLPTNVTKTGYTFTGWKNDSTGSIEKTISATATGNKSYTAQYDVVNYTITYKDGSTPITGLIPTTYNYETTVKLPTNATKLGYVFVGWYSNSNLTGTAVTTINKGTTTGNKTFYAKWQESNRKLTVVDVEGNALSNVVKVIANGDTTINENTPGSGVYNIPNLSTVEVYVTAPQGYYAKIFDSDGNYLSWDDIEYSTSTDEKPLTTAKFELEKVEADARYYVEYYKNPTIKVVQPKYGSIYITSGSGDNTKYYMNGESVYIETELTVHTMIDNNKTVTDNDGNRRTEFNSCTIDSVTYKPDSGSAVSLKKQELNKFRITDNTTVTAEITMNALYAFDEDTEKTEYGKRRIFFTDNANWDKDSKDTVSVHYSNVEEDTSAENFNITSNSIVMTYKYENEATQGVYYADIPFSAKYVIFYNNAKTEENTYEHTNVGTISNDSNAFYHKNGVLSPWHCEYSDYIATDRETTAQQGIVPINNTITFEYSCNFGDDTLSYTVTGNNANVEFNDGYLNITPTSDTYDYSLIKVTSKSSKTEKYYLVKLSKITAVVNEMQKIFPQINSVGLSGTFSSSSVLTSLQYYVSLTNFNDDAYVKLGDIKIPADKFSCDYDVTATAGTDGKLFSGVRFFKISAKDSAGGTLDVIQKTTFGTDSTSSLGRMVYLLNTTGVSMSKCNVRACFESATGNQSWVTMQQLENTDYYRANIPDGYDYRISFYLTHKKRYANIKSDEEGFNYICYFYDEDINLKDVYFNPIYQIKEFNSSDRTMKLVLQE